MIIFARAAERRSGNGRFWPRQARPRPWRRRIPIAIGIGGVHKAGGCNPGDVLWKHESGLYRLG